LIGVDTNVLVRLFVDDDAAQGAAARALVSDAARDGESILVTPLVLAELAWSLRSNFAFVKAEILDALDQLCRNAAFVVDDRTAVEAAVDAWRDGGADFADYLIAALARERGATTTMTFDRKAARTAAFTLLTA